MRGGANGGSIFDYQQERDKWEVSETDIRDPLWRLLRSNEAPLENGQIGAVDYNLDYSGDKEPYYWRHDNNEEQTT